MVLGDAVSLCIERKYSAFFIRVACKVMLYVVVLIRNKYSDDADSLLWAKLVYCTICIDELVRSCYMFCYCNRYHTKDMLYVLAVGFISYVCCDLKCLLLDFAIVYCWYRSRS